MPEIQEVPGQRMQLCRTRRTLYSGILLLILSTQWASGFCALQQTMILEIPVNTDPQTDRIASSFQQKHGLRTHLLTLDSLDHKFLNITGYGTAFIAKHEAAGEPHLVMMHSRTQGIEVVEHVINDSRAPAQTDGQTLVVERLFAPFYLQELPLFSTRQLTFYTEGPESTNELRNLCPFNIPSPPPWHA